jgi:hypothetical protein
MSLATSCSLRFCSPIFCATGSLRRVLAVEIEAFVGVGAPPSLPEAGSST